MSPFSLPPDVQPHELRRYAKDLVKVAASGDVRVLAKFAEIAKEPSLTSAQLLVAREFGFASWTKLKQQVSRNSADPGCLIDLGWVARRTTESAAVWKGLNRTVFCNLADPWPGWEEFTGGSRPFFALTYADGREVRSDSAHWVRRAQAEPDVDVPILRTVGGGGSSAEDDDEHHATTRLYLSPLPPAGDLSFTFGWPAFGVPRARSVIDATAINEAARRVRHL